jgi:hypothetical protein
LFIRNTFTGICSSTQVANSCTFMISEPSPARQTTSWSGQATFAPIADGRPKPIVPRPPELIHWRGRVKP